MSILVIYNENGYLAQRQSLENISSTSLQQVVNEYLKLNVGTLKQSEFKQLFKTPTDLIFDKITGGNLLIKGVKIDKAKAIEIIEKPKGYNRFISLLTDTLNSLEDTRFMPDNAPLTADNIDLFFTIDSDYNICFTETIEEKMKQSFKQFAVTDYAKIMFSLAESFIEWSEKIEIKNILKRTGNSIGTVINEVIETKNNGELSIRSNNILRYNNNRD